MQNKCTGEKFGPEKKIVQYLIRIVQRVNLPEKSNHTCMIIQYPRVNTRVFGAKYLMENEALKFRACLKYRKSLESARLSIKKAKDDLKHGNWLAVFGFKSQLGEFNV